VDRLDPTEQAALYPLYLDLRGRAVLVVGAGRVAARKVGPLLTAGAQVTVVAPDVSEEFDTFAGRAGITIEIRPFTHSDLDGKWLVIAATGSADINRWVSELAERARVFCNVVDDADLCTCHVPAVVRRGMLQLAISTGGASPALAAHLRRRLEREFGPAWAELLEALLVLRRHYRTKYPDDAATRSRLLKEFVESSAPALLVEAGDGEAFARELERWKAR
jgi:siroheme synthase-like protein